MSLKIRRACVLGAGVMGAQIAAHLAAAGVRCHLLDLSSDEPPTDKKLAKAVGKNVRNTRSILAIENFKKLRPAPLMTQSVLANIIPGNFDDDMSVIADCDWVIEAVIERIDIKKSIHAKIAEYARPNIPITTNTSGISLAEITEGMSEEYQSRFFGTHFFNPPRYMRLLEIIPHSGCDKEVINSLCTWISERLGKGIVYANDTVNFIANRVGVFATQSTLKHMGDHNLNVETIDALTGPLIGRAKSATMRTMDVVGLDTFSAVAANTAKKAPNDPYKEWFNGPQWILDLIEKGHLGQKTSKKGGCYLKGRDAKGKTEILAYRPETHEYVSQDVTVYPWAGEAKKIRDTVERIKFVIGHDDVGAKIVWRAVADVMSYSAFLLEEIADGCPKSVDEALKWGFNWEFGPFELWQALGHDEVLARMQKEEFALPAWAKPGIEFYKPAPNTIAWSMNSGPSEQFIAPKGNFQKLPKPSYAHSLPTFENKEDKRVVLGNKSASLVDIGHGVACLTFHSKMNAIDGGITSVIQESVAKVNSDFDALVVANDGRAFSAGANLKVIVDSIKAKDWKGVDSFIRDFQGTMQMLKFASFPTVACPQGLVLGGGCEVSLHTSHQLLAGETYAGLVEVGVGLVPAGGGTKELALRNYEMMKLSENGDPSAFIQRAFMLIGMGRTSTSGHEAIEMGLYPSGSTVSLSRDHQTERAKHIALQMVAAGYAPKIPASGVKVLGDPGIQTFRMMLYNMVAGRQVSEYDAFIGEKVATILCGGEVDAGTIVNEQHFLDLERRVFVELCQQPKTLDRIEHMLAKGRPLRN
jgi:3-hydroxyacyl-CoA dehydrogenase